MNRAGADGRERHGLGETLPAFVVQSGDPKDWWRAHLLHVEGPASRPYLVLEATITRSLRKPRTTISPEARPITIGSFTCH